MALNIWSSVGSTDGNLPGNWSLGALNATDVLTFNNTSVINCTFTGAVDCAGVDIDNNYTGAFDDGGQAFTISGENNIDSGGPFTATGIWIQDADADFVIAGASAWTVPAWSFVLGGSGDLENSSGIRHNVLNITCAANGKTTRLTGGSNWYFSNQFATANGGTINWNGQSVKARPVVQTDPWQINAGTTIAATPGSSYGVEAEPAAGAITIDLPGWNNGNLNTSFICNLLLKAVTFDMAAALVAQGLRANVNVANGSIAFNTNNFNITLTNDLNIYANNAGTFEFNAGASNISARDLLSWANGAGCVYNLGTATLSFTGDFAVGTDATINPGTSVVTFNGNNPCNVTLNGESLYDVVMNKTAAGMVPQGAFSCNDLTLTDGTWDSNGQTIACADLIVTTPDAKTFDATVTAVGDVTINVNTTTSRLVMSPGRTLTIAAGVTLVVSGFVNGDLDGITIVSGTPGVAGGLSVPANAVINNVNVTDNSATNVIDATNGGVDGGGNNGNWLFPTPLPPSDDAAARVHESKIGIGLALGIGI